MDNSNVQVHVIHYGDKIPADQCRHPATKLYTWFVDALVDPVTGQVEDDGLYPPGKILCATCCQCGTVVKGGV